VLGKLSGEDEADRGLDLTRRDGRLLVVGSELGGLGCDALKDVWKRLRIRKGKDEKRVELEKRATYH
jgi:hypothetical protein